METSHGVAHAARQPGAPSTDRWPTALLVAHALLVLFATLAMVTILAGEFPTWMQGSYTPRVYELAWRYTGQTYVVLGALAALLHAAPRFGWTRTWVVFLTATTVALASELLGTSAGLPFGAYHYTAMLGYRIAGHVPYVIPMSWSFMLYCALAMCGRLLSADDTRATRWTWAIAAGAMMVGWDVALEVQMTNVTPPHWVWDLGQSPSWFPDAIARPLFYGMPLSNWIGWMLTATLIARVLVAIVPPRSWRSQVSPAAFPLVLYAVNGVMPIATTARHGLWGAVVLGAIAMGVPVLIAARRKGPTAS